MEKDGFPTQLEIGKDYDNMVKAYLDIYSYEEIPTDSRQLIKESLKDIDVKMAEYLYEIS